MGKDTPGLRPSRNARSESVRPSLCFSTPPPILIPSIDPVSEAKGLVQEVMTSAPFFSCRFLSFHLAICQRARRKSQRPKRIGCSPTRQTRPSLPISIDAMDFQGCSCGACQLNGRSCISLLPAMLSKCKNDPVALEFYGREVLRKLHVNGIQQAPARI
jgi:hypothetical protein